MNTNYSDLINLQHECIAKLHAGDKEALRISYNSAIDYSVREWLSKCISKFKAFTDNFNAGNELHGRALDNSTLALLINNFEAFKDSINQNIEGKVKTEPSTVKDHAAATLYKFWNNVSQLWTDFQKEYQTAKDYGPDFPARYLKLGGIMEFPQIIADGVDVTIDRIKDDLYLSFAHQVDKEFVEEVQLLAEHYNRVMAKLKPIDQLYSFHILFKLDETNKVVPKVEDLRGYISSQYI